MRVPFVVATLYHPLVGRFSPASRGRRSDASVRRIRATDCFVVDSRSAGRHDGPEGLARLHSGQNSLRVLAYALPHASCPTGGPARPRSQSD